MARWWIVAGLVGCRSFDSVDEACKDHVRGDGNASPESAEFFGRVSCYRRYVGLGQANIDKFISEAAIAHAGYLEANGVDGSWQLETPGKLGFTGVDAITRIQTAGSLIDPQFSFVWEVLVPVDDALPRAEVVDRYFHHPLVRDVLLAPTWRGGGYQEFDAGAYGLYTYFHAVVGIPSASHTGKPVLYPADGQTDVPVAVAGLSGLEGVPSLAGYPISFTFGTTADTPAVPNPLQVSVDAAKVTGPSGPVDTLVFLPGNYEFGPDWSTAFLVPISPLEPDTTYDVEVTVGWVTNPSKDLAFSFTTGTETVQSPF